MMDKKGPKLQGTTGEKPTGLIVVAALSSDWTKPMLGLILIDHICGFGGSAFSHLESIICLPWNPTGRTGHGGWANQDWGGWRSVDCTVLQCLSLSQSVDCSTMSQSVDCTVSVSKRRLFYNSTSTTLQERCSDVKVKHLQYKVFAVS